MKDLDTPNFSELPKDVQELFIELFFEDVKNWYKEKAKEFLDSQLLKKEDIPQTKGIFHYIVNDTK